MAGTFHHSARLNRKITIQALTETRDTYGGITKTWTTHLIEYASVEPLMGRELFTAQQLDADVSYRFRIRYSKKAASITPKMRVSWDSNVYDIESVINPGSANHEILLMCRHDV